MIHHRRAASLLALSLLGICLSLGISGHVKQPDWSLALLVAALFSNPTSWPWLLPGFLAHDVILHWTVWGALPLAALTPYLLRRIDYEISTALLRRMMLMTALSAPLLWLSVGLDQWLLTLLLCLPLWHWLAIRPGSRTGTRTEHKALSGKHA